MSKNALDTISYNGKIQHVGNNDGRWDVKIIEVIKYDVDKLEFEINKEFNDSIQYKLEIEKCDS